jgi:hypothetical protein
LNEVVPEQIQQAASNRMTSNLDPGTFAQSTSDGRIPNQNMARRSAEPVRQSVSWSGIFFYTVREGDCVLVTSPDGKVRQEKGPKTFWRWRCKVDPLVHHVAHPCEFLIVCYRDGRQEHLSAPAHLWQDPTQHSSIEKEDVLQIGNREAIVVYSKGAENNIVRRIVHGPATFMPAPGEWLHTFAWHGTKGGAGGYHKVPNGLIFQKVWLMPDQMYHDVVDVRTADDAVLTIRLMIFFVLEDLLKMLETTHDPIGDFINATTSDVIAFTGHHSFDSFKKNIQQLNELETYTQLIARAAQCGFRISKLVYRGYGAPDSLQRMHDEAIESRTRLQLERATREQAQDLEDFSLERTLARAGRQRQEQELALAHELAASEQKRAAELKDKLERRTAARELEKADAEQSRELRQKETEVENVRLESLQKLGVDLTTYLTKNRADTRIEIAGGSPVHVEAAPMRLAGHRS